MGEGSVNEDSFKYEGFFLHKYRGKADGMLLQRLLHKLDGSVWCFLVNCKSVGCGLQCKDNMLHDKLNHFNNSFYDVSVSIWMVFVDHISDKHVDMQRQADLASKYLKMRKYAINPSNFWYFRRLKAV